MRGEGKRKSTLALRLSLPVGLGLGLIAAGFTGLSFGFEPFATWFYVFAWYGTLLVVDAAIALTGGPPGAGMRRFLFLGRGEFTLTLLGWSAVLWFFFELLNFRLRNWYYVFVPDEPFARMAGVTLSFATVLPAVLGVSTLLANLGLGRRARCPRLQLTPRRLKAIQGAAVLLLLLPLARPTWFFPLVWGFTTLLLEPWVYRRAPERSLLHDLEHGRPGRILRLLASGVLVGLLWEVFNLRARSKWIYTVPGLDGWKLFEMPLPGFLGFPPFAIDCFVIWQALVVAGLAVPRVGPVFPASAKRRGAATVLAAFLAAGALRGMEARTISSYTPRLEGLATVVRAAGGDAERTEREAARLAAAGYDVFGVAQATPAELARRAALDPTSSATWVRAARLAVLRGIGTEHARRLIVFAGIDSVERLAAADAGQLALRLARVSDDVVPARIRVWVRAARREAGNPALESNHDTDASMRDAARRAAGDHGL